MTKRKNKVSNEELGRMLRQMPVGSALVREEAFVWYLSDIDEPPPHTIYPARSPERALELGMSGGEE